MPFESVAAWNTGRGYTLKGQRVAAGLCGVDVYFADIDREIFGKISMKPWRSVFYDDDEIQMYVMSNYDTGQYENVLFQEVKELIDFAILVKGIDLTS